MFRTGYPYILARSHKEFEEVPVPEASPMEALGEIFLESVDGDDPGVQDVGHLCPTCREELGIVNILGFSS